MTSQFVSTQGQNNLLNNNVIKSVKHLKISKITDLLEVLNLKKTYYIKTNTGYEISCVFFINDKEIIANRTYQQQKGIIYTIDSLEYTSIELLDFLVNSLPEKSKNILLDKFYDEIFYNNKINVDFNRYIFYKAEKKMRKF
jgi:hypothetical protein